MTNARRPHALARVLAVVLSGVVLSAAALPAAVWAQNPTPAQIDALFAEWDRPGSPGCVLGVMRDGAMVYERGYGFANLDWDVPITPETVFYVGSISKQFTAASAMLLVRDGRLDLDADIRTYLPEMPAYERPVTVRHLVHHTSGVRDLYGAMGDAWLRVEDVFPDSAALALLAARDSLDFLPGEKYSYSNGGYFLLKTIIERVSGQSLREFADARIFGPLGMRDTHFHDRPGHVVERRAMSYAPDSAGSFVQNYMSNFDKVGAGGLYSTVRDLLRWDGIFYDDVIGGAGFADALLQRGVLANGDTLAYAFALNDTNYRGLRLISHSGSMMGFRADFIRFPAQHLSVAALCNLGTIQPSRLTRAVAALYLGPLMTAEEQR